MLRRSKHRFANAIPSIVLLAVTAAAGLRPTAAAPAPERATLERRFESAMKDKRFAEAAALGDSLVRRRETRERLTPVGAATVLDSLGKRLFFAGSPEAWAAAEPLFRAGLARRERALGPDDPSVASSLTTLSTLLGYLGRWTEAIPLAERAVAIRTARLGERHPDTASSLRQLGFQRFQLGDYAAAREPFERSLAIYQALGDGYEVKVADGHNSLGELARIGDRLDSAETHFRRGLDIARAHLDAGDPVRVGLENNLAGLEKDLGRYDEAEPLLENGIATLERSGGDPGTLAIARLNLAEVRRLQGRPEDAVALYEQALEEVRALLGGSHPDLVPFLNQTAVCEQAVGRFARAESLYLETGRLVAATLGPDHPLVAQNLGDLAGLRLATGRAVEADTLLARAIALRERALGASHPDVALLLVERARAVRARDSEAAAAMTERAIRILDEGRAYPDARVDAYAQRAEWHAAHGRRDQAIADMAVALTAIDSLRSWRGGGDETRAAFLASRLALVDRMVEWQLAAGRVADALATHERSRARVLLDQIAASGVDLRAGIPRATLEPLEWAEHAAEARLAAAHRRIADVRSDPALAPSERLETLARLAARRDSASLDLALARRRIEDLSPVWRAVLSSEGRIASLAELERDVVPRDGLMLVYHVGDRASWVFVVPPHGAVEAQPLAFDAEAAATLGAAPGPIGEATLERIITGDVPSRRPNVSGSFAGVGIATLLSGVSSGGFVTLPFRTQGAEPDSFELRLASLWRGLVPPALRKRLLAARTALVVPDGPLHPLAFEALVMRTRGRAGATRYWLDDGPAIAYGPSATALRSLWLRPRRTAPTTGNAPEVLSVSDVAYVASDSTSAATASARNSRTWRPLPGTRLESEAIRAAFEPGRVQVLEGAHARESAVRAAMSQPAYIHLATHGFADVTHDRLSAGLVLAPPPAVGEDSDDDGLLELFEIHRLSLHCELAVLSACETAKGPRVAGEGAFALSRGFLAAGARSVIASLWAVDDQPTARIVGTLFDSIAAAEKRKRAPDLALALRDAKLRVRDDPQWADPFYWAPFVLSGR